MEESKERKRQETEDQKGGLGAERRGDWGQREGRLSTG